MPVATTLLSITGAGVDIPEYALRGLTMTLTPIGQAVQMARTINGTLVNLAEPQFQNKYAAVISGADVQSPAFAGVTPGTSVVVNCIAGLGVDTEGTPLSLTMRVGQWSEQRTDWEAESTWSLPLESI